ncbi:MAG: hypothetical protein DME59_00425 [Verrucomicrobia bacterium]|nr:MAG: hypothetical protein DME59_00425 [Verrucomicrobiota bacterium]
MFTPIMLPRFRLCAAVVLTACCSAEAAGIRQFSIKTTERLGRELYEQAQRGNRLSEPQQGARRAAMAALPELEREGYKFVVLSDPEHKGYLVYALASSRNPDDVVVGVHYRVSVSANGKVQRIDPLARSTLVIPANAVPPGTQAVGFHCTCLVSNQPVETLVYLTLLHGKHCAVGTANGTIWFIENGKITKDGKVR